jgi:predicted tellurium resistance membrane protein TerC
MEWLADPQIWASFITLSALEIVLGVDNLVFLSLLAGRLPPLQRAAGRRVGLALALLTRLALLGSISWLAHLTEPVFVAGHHDVSLRDLILLGGGLFLLFKGTREILAAINGEGKPEDTGQPTPSFFGTIVQIALLDIVFSLDSVITAVGIAQEIWVMVAAIVVAMFVMLLASNRLAAFIEHHASVKMLALAFILLIGCVLVADGAGLHIPRNTIYAAMGFAVVVESLNLLRHRVATRQPNRKPIVEGRRGHAPNEPHPVNQITLGG